jgi:hypothetical protein
MRTSSPFEGACGFGRQTKIIMESVLSAFDHS